MMSRARDRLIVALDVPRVEQARTLIDALQDSVGVYKIGLELLFAGGMALASELAARGNRVFIDAKLLDIETTVERATVAIARTGAEFLTVHAVDAEKNLLLVKGAVPGPTGGLVLVRSAAKRPEPAGEGGAAA